MVFVKDNITIRPDQSDQLSIMQRDYPLRFPSRSSVYQHIIDYFLNHRQQQELQDKQNKVSMGFRYGVTTVFAVFMTIGLNWTSVLLERANNTQPSIQAAVNAAYNAGLVDDVRLMQYGELINLNIFCLAGTILCCMIAVIQLIYDAKIKNNRRSDK